MIKQYMHRPQSASSRNSRQPEIARLKTEEKQQDRSMRQPNERKSVHVMDERSQKGNTYNGGCELNVSNPELAELLKVDKKLLDDRDWGRHLKDQCLCKMCTCGKHKCHLHPIKLGLTLPDSTYARNYRTQGSCPNERVRIPTEAKHEPIIVGTTSYANQYGKKQTHLEHPKKFADNLHAGGPMIAVTTYKQNFVAKSSPSQYLEVDKAINFPVGTPITGASNYRETYKWRSGRPSAAVIAPDMMPVQSNLAFLGKSSYQSDFRAPTRDQYPERVYDPRRRENSMGPASNKTTYRNEFSTNCMSMCPAEVERRRNNITLTYN